jgi:hypothetical protein
MKSKLFPENFHNIQSYGGISAHFCFHSFDKVCFSEEG